MGAESPEPLDLRIGRIAARQHGNISHAQLAAVGCADDAIARRVKRGMLYRVYRCAYAVGRPPATPVERAAAAVLACGPGAALSHLSALALWGFVSRWPRAVDVASPLDRRPRGIRTHQLRCLERSDVRVQLGIRTTSPARTALDCAPLLDPLDRTRVVNDALLTPFLNRGQLADVRRRFPTHRGARLLEPFIDDATGGPTRSRFEDEFLVFCERQGLPRPRVNTRVAGREVDALFETERLIVECDGWEYHRHRHAFESDRNRDADQLAAGYATVRVTRARLRDRPTTEARRLRTILARRSRDH